MNPHRLWLLAVTALSLFCQGQLAFLSSSNRIVSPKDTDSTEVAGASLYALPREIGEQKNSGATSSDSSKPLTAPLHVEIPAAPWAFQANGKWHLVYELHVANIGAVDCVLSNIKVVAAVPAQRQLSSLTGTDLNAIIVHPNADVAAPATIPPAGFAVVYMWLTVDRREDVPAAFFHRITMKLRDYLESLYIDTLPVAVNRDPVPVIGPPLWGGDWAAAHGPKNDSRHRRGLITIDGHAYIGERFAIDWLRITPAGDIHTGDAGENKNYPGYGAEVLAVADGVITEERDGIPENTPGSVNAVPITLQTICGNHVIQRFGKGLYASYCHLQPGSIRVKPGARVKRGQVLGLVGNSGNSTAPHLHFQVCNANSILACEGVPYAFRMFVQESKSFDPPEAAKPQPDVVHKMEIPTFEALVRFDPEPKN